MLIATSNISYHIDLTCLKWYYAVDGQMYSNTYHLEVREISPTFRAE